MNLADVADGDLLTEWVPGFAGTITDFLAIVNKAATTADKASTLNLEIETTNVTGSELALTSANMTPKGAKVACTGITLQMCLLQPKRSLLRLRAPRHSRKVRYGS